MIKVTARTRIVTPGKFVIAEKGDEGRVVEGEMPHMSRNLGRVLVVFDGREKGYWCETEWLKFPTGCNPLNYIAVRKTTDPYEVAFNIPLCHGVYSFHFGNNLKLCRQARRLSQARLGEEMGKHGLPLAQSTVCYHERSPESPGGQFVTAAAKALKVPVFVFFLDLENCAIFDKTKSFLASLSANVCNA